MSSYNYCRRRIDKDDGQYIYCGKKIVRVNALDWCPECRKRLPFWPTDAVQGE